MVNKNTALGRLPVSVTDVDQKGTKNHDLILAGSLHAVKRVDRRKGWCNPGWIDVLLVVASCLVLRLALRLLWFVVVVERCVVPGIAILAIPG